jgi:hypothetical protein
MSIPTDEDFVRQWAAENGCRVESGWCDQRVPGFVLLDNSIKTSVARGETIELAFSRMASMLKGEASS